jgi:hypothetical protein
MKNRGSICDAEGMDARGMQHHSTDLTVWKFQARRDNQSNPYHGMPLKCPPPAFSFGLPPLVQISAQNHSHEGPSYEP